MEIKSGRVAVKKILIDKACTTNKWVASRTELEQLIREVNNRKFVLSDLDLEKMIRWFKQSKLNENDSIETMLTKFYWFINSDVE